MARLAIRKAVYVSGAVLFIFLFGCQTPTSSTYRSASAETEPVGVNRGLVRVQNESGQNVGLYRGSYALVIGVSNYTRRWPRLPGVKQVPWEPGQIFLVVEERLETLCPQCAYVTEFEHR